MKSADVPFTEIYRTLGLSRNTVACWLYRERSKINSPPDRRCPFCCRPARSVDRPADYAYLLWMYLGDGHLLTTRRVPLLKVACDLRYPGVINEVGAAMLACGARVVGHQRRDGRDDVRSSWMHWPCLLPQHGPGKKHQRALTLTDWAVANRRGTTRQIPSRPVPLRRLPDQQQNSQGREDVHLSALSVRQRIG